jgi:serine protease Do
MEALNEIEELIGQTAERVGPSVVGLGRGWGVGSGFVIASGRVLTNAHNLRHEETTVAFDDGRHEAGSVVAADPDLDIAVLEVDTGAVAPIEWTPVADSSPEIGRIVLALANPGGRGLRVTQGYVSSATGSFRGPRGRRVNGAIEHTAPLPRGSSGGPLVDAQGSLLGINSVRVDGSLILAIAADGALREHVEALGRGESPPRLRLGVAIAPPRVARRLRRAVGLPERDGVLVRGVQRGSAAEPAGLQRGDLIVAAAGAPIDRTEVLYGALDSVAPGGTLELTILRGTDERAVVVEFPSR